MVDKQPTTTNVTSVPKYLDVQQKLKAPPVLENAAEGKQWALFRDCNGRVLAQWFDLVANEQSYAKHVDEPIQRNTESKNPEFILVVATDYAQETTGIDCTANFSENLDDDDIPESAVIRHKYNKDYSIDGSILNDERDLINDKAYESEFFPCVREQWYVRQPLTPGNLIDDIAVVNTSVLANDVRVFLKNNSISIESFAKIYMKRTQGTVSDLLNHPKKWQELSRKGRDTYVKFMEFLSDDNLPISIREMRSKNSFTCPDRLPNSLMDRLQQGIQPTEKELSNISILFPLKLDTLRSYCQQQLSMQVNPKFNGYDQPEEHISDILGHFICGKPGCGTVMRGRAALNLHLEKNCENQCYCSLCEHYFKTKSSFDSHFQHCHKPFMVCSQPPLFSKFDDIADNDLLVQGDDVDLETQKFICCVCWSGFKSRQRLTRHLTAKHEVGQKDLRPGVSCFVCFKILRNLHALDVHMRTHTNARPFPCHSCSAAFQTKANLQRHIKTHTGEKPYGCTYCAARFIEEKALVIHSRTHTGEKPFKCPNCGKRFVHKTPLKLHMLIHEGKKPHSCSQCGKSFRQKINLQVHMKRHSGSKKYKCTTCDLSFLTKTDWNRHNMMHTGEKPFQCQLCSKSFTRNIYLQEHLNRLKNCAAPQCDICEKRFCNEATLKTHKKSHVVLPDSDNLSQGHKLDKENSSLDTFQYPDVGSANANILLLSAKSSVNNDRQYFVTPIQSIEGSSDDSMNRLSLQSVMLSQNNDGYGIPITGVDGQPLFLQCVDLSGTSAPLFGSNGELLSTLKDIAIPITFTTGDETANQTMAPILEVSDPNMQSTVSKSFDDSGMLNEDISRGTSTNTMHLPEEQTHMIVTGTQHTSDSTVMTIPQQHAGNDNDNSRVPVCVSDVILTETNSHELSTSCDDVSKNQTFVIVEP